MGFLGLATTDELRGLERLIEERLRRMSEENRRLIDQEVRMQVAALRSGLSFHPIELAGGNAVTLDQIIEAVVGRIHSRLEEVLGEKIKEALGNLNLNDLGNRIYNDLDIQDILDKLVVSLVPVVRGDLDKDDLIDVVADKFLEDADFDELTQATAEAVAGKMRYVTDS